MPKIPPELASAFNSQPAGPSLRLFQGLSPLSSSNKENAPPQDLQTPPRLPVPVDPSSSNERVPDSQPSQARATDDGLPPPLASLLASAKSTLRHNFGTKPPHTIQRLAELILRPTHHYRTLPAYLRALDRVVSVSSSADTFPLPQAGYLGDGNQPNGVANGTRSGFMMMDNSLGSDESLGGALLTPIPWLTNRPVENNEPGLVGQGNG
jgi:PPP4R2